MDRFQGVSFPYIEMEAPMKYIAPPRPCPPVSLFSQKETKMFLIRGVSVKLALNGSACWNGQKAGSEDQAFSVAPARDSSNRCFQGVSRRLDGSRSLRSPPITSPQVVINWRHLRGRKPRRPRRRFGGLPAACLSGSTHWSRPWGLSCTGEGYEIAVIAD